VVAAKPRASGEVIEVSESDEPYVEPPHVTINHLKNQLDRVLDRVVRVKKEREEDAASYQQQHEASEKKVKELESKVKKMKKNLENKERELDRLKDSTVVSEKKELEKQNRALERENQRLRNSLQQMQSVVPAGGGSSGSALPTGSRRPRTIHDGVQKNPPKRGKK